MLKEQVSVSGVVATTAPPLAISAAPFLGLTLERWVLFASLLYTTFQIIRLLPRMYGCARCFMKNWSCYQTCKDGNEQK